MNKPMTNNEMKDWEAKTWDRCQKQAWSEAMNRDDIIRMAREAGFVDESFCRWGDDIIRMALEAVVSSLTDGGGRQANYHELYDHLLMSTDALERFFHAAAAAGAAAEREACAKVCEEGGKDASGRIHVQAWGAAKAIRARGEK